MKRKSLLWLAVLYWVCTARLQAQSKQGVSPSIGKWECATDLLWLINKNHYPLSVFVRRHTAKGAWRLRVSGNMTRRREIVAIPQSGITQEYLLVPGHEWHLRLPHKRIVPYVGIDLPFSYYSNRDPADYLLPPQTLVTNTFSTDLSLGVAGIFGVRYHISRHFSVSMELKLQSNYQRKKITSQTNSTPNDVRLHQSEINTQFVPLQMLSISYHFTNKNSKQ